MDSYPVLREPPVSGSEIESLLGSLDRQRRTLFWKCADLDADALRVTIAASTLTLGGLLRHLALFEDEYFSVQLAGRPRHPAFSDPIHGPDEAMRWTWTGGGEPAAWTVALWRETVARSRSAIADRLAHPDALETAAGPPVDGYGTPTLRRRLVDMIEEYARHTGHADLIREAIDGRTGEDPPAAFPDA